MSDQFPRIIGLSGRAGSGKTTVATILYEEYGYAGRTFAKTLKEAAKLIYGLSFEQIYGDEREVVDERYGMTPRTILQRFGTEVCREVHPDTWVMALERQIEPSSLAEGNRRARYAIHDVRFTNEVEAIERWGGVVWRIVGRETPGVDSSHISERPFDVDVVIDNSGTKEELLAIVERLIEGGV